eukprot:50403_1
MSDIYSVIKQEMSDTDSLEPYKDPLIHPLHRTYRSDNDEFMNIFTTISTSYHQEASQSLQYQRKWMWIHIVYILFVSIISIPLLHRKSAVLNEFYDHEQCCYCLWVSENHDDNYAIEWSTCKNKHKYSFNLEETCSIDGSSYCQNGSASNTEKGSKLDYTISLIGFDFPTYYPFYGIVSVVLVLIYVSLLITFTYAFKLLIHVKLLIGNLYLTTFVYYTYIKLYQYSLFDYDELCPNPPPINPMCYKSALTNGLDTVFSGFFTSMVYFYFAYAIVWVYPCCCYLVVRCNRKYRIMSIIARSLSSFLLYTSTLLGIIFVVFLYIELMRMTIGVDNNFAGGLIQGVNPNVEKVFIMGIANTLLVFAFDMFFLRRCREQLRAMLASLFTCSCRDDRKWRYAEKRLASFDTISDVIGK